MTMSPEDFEKVLRDIYMPNGKIDDGLEGLYAAQANHVARSSRYSGFWALSSAFATLFYECVELLNHFCRPRMTKELSEHYALFVPELVNMFKSLCASAHIAATGYPYSAYTILRNVYDSAILTTGVVSGIADFYAVHGITPGQPYEPNAGRRLRRKTETEIRSKVTGNDSGLASDIIDELAKWDGLFDLEVHGARLSLTQSQDWMKRTGLMHVSPHFDDEAFAMFMNRYGEIAWMIHRLMPLLQPPEVPFPEEWGKKWKTVDEAFEQNAGSLTQQLNKKIGAAIVALVSAKFPYSEKTCFPL